MPGGPIALISGRDPHDEGGHESYVRAHAMAAERAGYEAHVFCEGRRSERQATGFGVVHRVRTPPHRTAPALLSVPTAASLPYLARAVTAFLARSPRVELIHSFGIWSAAGVMASRQLARQGVTAIPLTNAYATSSFEARGSAAGVHDYHGMAHRVRYGLRRYWVDGVDSRIEGWGYGHSRLVLVNYESVRRILIDAYGDGLALRRIPYCPPSAFQAPPPVPPAVPGCLRALTPAGAPLILSTSRHGARKGTDVLLHALGRLRAEGVPFRACLVGPGTLLERHRRLVVRLGLSGQVVLPGPVPQIEPYLAAADIFVLPSRREASGSVSVLEAMRAGLPVVSSDCDGMPEDLSHESDALLVRPDDVAGLAAALRRLLGDPPLRARLSAAARSTFAERFSADALTDALGGVYASLGAGAAAGAAPARIDSAT